MIKTCLATASPTYKGKRVQKLFFLPKLETFDHCLIIILYHNVPRQFAHKMQPFHHPLLFTFVHLSMVAADETSHATFIHPRDFSRLVSTNVFSARDQCHSRGDVCAEFMIGAKVSQQLMEYDPGCSRVKNMDQITAINVYDCICGLWW